MPQLPFELIQSIAEAAVDLEAVDAGQRSKLVSRLRSLSLVCRAWLVPCQKVLFMQYTFGHSDLRLVKIDPLQLPRFAYLVAHPHLTAHVAYLSVSTLWETDYAEIIVNRMHEVFPNVISLEIDDGGNEDMTMFDEGELASFIEGFPRLQMLDIALEHERCFRTSIFNH
jgi:hypothetical protein